MQPHLSTKPRQQQRGITLIEALITMVIFSVGMLGMNALQLRVYQQTRDQHQRDVVIWKAQAFMNRISLNNSATALQNYVDNVDSVDDANNPFCDNAPTTVCAETYNVNTNTEVAAAVCTETQLATYDTWEIFCSDGEGLSDELATLTPSLECLVANTGDPCSEGDSVELELQWASYASGADARLAGNTTIVHSDKTVHTIKANIERYRQVFIP